MNVFRILLNVIVAIACVCGGVYLLLQESLFLHDRWHPETGTYFDGLSLWFLAFALLLLGAFAAVVTRAWLKGIVPMLDRKTWVPHPTYKGQIIVRYWYLVIPAFALIAGSVMLAKHIPNPALERTPSNGAAESSG